MSPTVTPSEAEDASSIHHYYSVCMVCLCCGVAAMFGGVPRVTATKIGGGGNLRHSSNNH